MTPVSVDFQPLEEAARANVLLPRGAVIRVVDAKEPERELDLLVVENRDAESGFGVMPASGYKAGIFSLHSPAAAREPKGISTEWLLANWTGWYSVDAPDALFVAPQGYQLRATP